MPKHKQGAALGLHVNSLSRMETEPSVRDLQDGIKALGAAVSILIQEVGELRREVRALSSPHQKPTAAPIVPVPNRDGDDGFMIEEL